MFTKTPGKFNAEPDCLCSFNNNCGDRIIINHKNLKRIPVPGFVWRCSTVDTILSSTLECFYSNSNCLKNILLHYINYTNFVGSFEPINASLLIRTQTNSTVATLADNLFVEEWKISVSYMQYFNACAPNLCKYTYGKRANILYVVSMFLSIYGGLTLGLSLLAPLVVKSFLRIQYQQISISKFELYFYRKVIHTLYGL